MRRSAPGGRLIPAAGLVKALEKHGGAAARLLLGRLQKRRHRSSAVGMLRRFGVILPHDDLRRDELIGLIGHVFGIALARGQRHRLAGTPEQWLLTNEDIEDEAAA